MKRSVMFLLTVLWAATTSVFAQEARIEGGRLEVGGFPGVWTWFTGGNGDDEAAFNTFNAGGYVDWYANSSVGVELEVVGGIGLAQDIEYHRTLISHNEPPYTWSYGGNVL